MFIIKTLNDNKLHIWNNKKQDDFLRFVPSNLNCSLSNIEIYLLPDESDKYQQSPVKCIESDKIYAEIYRNCQIVDEQEQFTDLLKTYEAKKIDYPYDSDDNYIEPTY